MTAKAVDAIETVDEYLARYGGLLGANVMARARPLYDPTRHCWEPRMDKLLRRPYRAQGDTVMAAVTALRRQGHVVVVGEMGTGKTLMGCAIAQLLWKRPYRALVMCPPHLVRKWEREIRSTIPHAVTKIVRAISDVSALRGAGRPTSPEWYVLSRERGKLGYFWRPAHASRLSWERTSEPDRRGRTRVKIAARRVPACAGCGAVIVDDDGNVADEAWLARAKRRCRACKEALWTADNTRVRRYPIGEYIGRYLPKGTFEILLADELHELKGASTAQGNTLGRLCASIGKRVGLTGTLLGGYADDVYHMLFRLDPRSMIREDLAYGDAERWMKRYGVLEYVTKIRDREDNLRSRGSRTSKTVKRKPGVSPAMFGRHLMGSAVFIQLEDVSAGLPPLVEDVCGVEMSTSLKGAYEEVRSVLESAMRSALASGSKRFLGAYLMNLLAYPDRPFDNDPIYDPMTGEGGARRVLLNPPSLPKREVYPKEEALLRWVEGELADDRRVWIYAVFTQKKDVTARLAELIRRRLGANVAVLKASVQAEGREEWVAERVAEGVRVVISNPRLVETGVDLLEFPSIGFYETGYSIFTLRQASRRSWRIGQTREVRVRYFYYRDSLQEAAMRLMGAKLKASLSVEGRFSAEGLLALTQGEDLMTALAKAVSDRIGDDLESAESYWRSHQGGEAAALREAAVGRTARVTGAGMLFEMPPAANAPREEEEEICEPAAA